VAPAVDGFNLAYRCFFAIPELTRADGFPTNALHGWVKSLWKLADQEKPDNTSSSSTSVGPDDRLALHPEYKAHREEMPEALSKQIPIIKELTRAMGLAGDRDRRGGERRPSGLARHDTREERPRGPDRQLRQGLCPDRERQGSGSCCLRRLPTRSSAGATGRGRRRREVRRARREDRRLPRDRRGHLGQHPGPDGRGTEDGEQVARPSMAASRASSLPRTK
jgi:hypothetical protein